MHLKTFPKKNSFLILADFVFCVRGGDSATSSPTQTHWIKTSKREQLFSNQASYISKGSIHGLASSSHFLCIRKMQISGIHNFQLKLLPIAVNFYHKLCSLVTVYNKCIIICSCVRQTGLKDPPPPLIIKLLALIPLHTFEWAHWAGN